MRRAVEMGGARLGQRKSKNHASISVNDFSIYDIVDAIKFSRKIYRFHLAIGNIFGGEWP